MHERFVSVAHHDLPAQKWLTHPPETPASSKASRRATTDCRQYAAVDND